MKKVFQLIFLMAICSSQYSQDYKFMLYTSPLMAADFISHPMVSLGGEFVLGPRLGIAAEYGFKYLDNSRSDTLWEKSEGYTCRIELKFYDIHKLRKESIRSYISFEYRYIKDTHNEIFAYCQDTSSVSIIEDNYGVLKNVHVGNIKYGLVIRLGKRFYTDVYCGIGIRYRDIRNTHREYNPDIGNEPAYVDDIFSSFGLSESKLYPNLSWGFKFGIRF